MGPDLTIAAAFTAGFLTFASPCFLPLVPVFVSYFAGGAAIKDEPATASGASAEAAAPAAARTERPARQRLNALAHALVFALAFSAVFVLLWSVLASIGVMASGYRTWIRIGAGVVMVILGAHIAGYLKIGVLERTARLPVNVDAAAPPTWTRSALLGITFAAGWTPCVGPALGAILALSSTTSSVGAGALLLAVFCAGLAVPMLILAVGSQWLLARLDWLKSHPRLVSEIAGLIIIGTGIGIIVNVIPNLSGHLASLF